MLMCEEKYDYLSTQMLGSHLDFPKLTSLGQTIYGCMCHNCRTCGDPRTHAHNHKHHKRYTAANFLPPSTVHLYLVCLSATVSSFFPCHNQIHTAGGVGGSNTIMVMVFVLCLCCGLV